jgi:hypothetical protein
MSSPPAAARLAAAADGRDVPHDRHGTRGASIEAHQRERAGRPKMALDKSACLAV